MLKRDVIYYLLVQLQTTKKDNDFTMPIPNLLTRKKSLSDSSYKECTLEKAGLWQAI